VEILVVLAVIALLAALLLPVLARTRESARRIACASHLRQVGIALQAYVDDHDGFYPVSLLTAPAETDMEEGESSSDWEDAIEAYFQSEPIFRCPSDPSPAEFFEMSYALNASFAAVLHETAITYPAETIVVADRRNTLLNQDRPALFVWWEWQGNLWPPRLLPDPTPSASRDLALERHGDGLNFLFSDGHIRHARFRTTWGAGRANLYWPQRP
jgi:prepilin-type processing-associated H-X9-DG protein